MALTNGKRRAGVIRRVSQRIVRRMEVDIREMAAELSVAEQRDIAGRIKAAKAKASTDWLAVIAMFVEIIKLIQDWLNNRNT